MKNKIILHRGYKGKYPENSEISFINALKENLSFETDIRLSKDGIPYLVHDNSLDRLFNGSGKISSLGSKELERFRYKEDINQKLFSLKELCNLVKKSDYKNLIFIHIKELKDIEKVINVLEDYDFKEIIRFFSVDEITTNLIKVIKEKYPEYKTGLHFNDNSTINEKMFKMADFIWADEIKKENINKELVEFSHKLKKPIYAISPEIISESIFNKDIKKRWEELIDNGVDKICTDLPQEFLRLSIQP